MMMTLIEEKHRTWLTTTLRNSRGFVKQIRKVLFLIFVVLYVRETIGSHMGTQNNIGNRKESKKAKSLQTTIL